jgi:hypothetical protein
MLEYLDELIKPIQKYGIKEEFHSIFQMISPFFYRENYHSDILSYLLTYNGAKKALIDWINQYYSKEIDYDDYIDGIILREDANVDILLLSTDRTKSIIIENKSNNAVDQKSQVYNYYKIINKKHIVQAIVYLNKNALKKPNLSSAEYNEIKEFLVCAQLVGKNSFGDVLENIFNNSGDIRLQGLAMEIKDFFNFLIYGGKNMEDTDLFVKELMQDDNLGKLKVSIEQYNKLPHYFGMKYKNYIETKTTKFDLGFWKPTYYLCLNAKYPDRYISVDFEFSLNKVNLILHNRKGEQNQLEQFVGLIGNRLSLTKTKNIYKSVINNPFDDDEIKRQIDIIIDALEEFIK